MERLTDPETWDEPLFPTGIVATGAHVSPSTLHSWFRRGKASLQAKDVPAGGNGLPHKFSFRSALTIGCMAELVRLGEEPATAFAAAFDFANVTDPLEGAPRIPAGLFADPLQTFLVTWPHESGQPYRVVAIGNGPGGLAIPAELIVGRGSGGARLVWLNWVDFHMRGMCEAYLRDEHAPKTFADLKAGLGAGPEVG